MSGYNFRDIESKWQTTWETQRTFRAPNPGEEGFDPKTPKYYVLDMFPYPSGIGLHVGHPLGYIATDIVARYKRMRGFNVLHPMGFDAFGLPAEQFAVEHGVHPRKTTEENIANMVRQLKRLGLSYDWDRRLATTDVDYYKFTQWIFLQLFNSYLDPRKNAARPITQLERRLESGELAVLPDGELIEIGASGAIGVLGGLPAGASRWSDLTAEERDDVLADQRLAYLAEVPVNWCPALGTVLANEEVTNDGRSERGNHPVFKRPLKQWMLRITAYAQRLGDDLDLVDWPEPIKLMQRNWIGRSDGAHVDFKLAEGDETIRVFTTRPDTLFGATYMVIAPEHPLVEEITTPAQLPGVQKYQAEVVGRTDIDRMAEGKTKSGVFTGAFALNPVNGQRVPIWIADYVLMGYGTGAIMAVPAHDERDFAFAIQFGLPVRAVVMADDAWLTERAKTMPDCQGGSAPCDLPGVEKLRAMYRQTPAAFGAPFTGDGAAINSANDDVSLDGLATPVAKQRTTQWLEDRGLGQKKVQYKLRDWLFSRQRYWGEPFPILHGPDGRIRAVDVKDLPVALPEMQDFRPTASDDPNAPPRPPLGRAPESWRHVEIDGVKYERELNTMPQWAGSCWYYLRFLDPRNEQRFVGAEAERYWMLPGKGQGPRAEGRGTEKDHLAAASGSSLGPRPSSLGPSLPGVDLYVGGAEHAVLHLLYSRFWHKVLFDLGHVSTPEPFGRLFNQGYIQAYAYQDERGIYVDATKIEEKDGRYFYDGKPVTRTLGKMGKSLKNAVSPDEVCEQYGCDTMRLYEMYMGPLDASKPWETRDIIGMHRFLQRVWRNFVADDGSLRVTDEPDDSIIQPLHKTIKKVTGAMDSLRLNSAIAALIDFNNAMVPLRTIPWPVAETFVRMLAPLAPHICEELWEMLGHDHSLAREPWPLWDESLAADKELELPVQVLGKVRSRITVPADADEKTVEKAALADEKIAALIAGKTVRKVIIVPGKMVNIVAN